MQLINSKNCYLKIKISFWKKGKKDTNKNMKKLNQNLS